MFTHNGVKLSDLFRGIISTFAVVGIVGEHDLGDKFPQGFFVTVGFDGIDFFLLGIPTLSPSPNTPLAQLDLRSDLLIG